MLRTTILSLLFVLTGYLSAQQCTVTGSDFDLCTGCAGGTDPALVGGVFTGTLVIGPGVHYTLPTECKGGITFAGEVTIRLENQSSLTVPDDLPVVEGTTFTVTGRQGNIRAYAGGLAFRPNGGAHRDLVALSHLLSTCGPVTLCRSVANLPVTLLSWEARPDAGGGVELRWVTATEEENDHFLVEHSTDGKSFTELGRVSGGGTRSSEIAYRYRHHKPGGGTHYYRLGQRDFDGTLTHFGVLSVEIIQRADGVPYPNPAAAGSRLFVGAGTAVTLLRVDGRELKKFTAADGGGWVTLPGRLPAGIYLLRAGDRTHRLVVR